MAFSLADREAFHNLCRDGDVPRWLALGPSEWRAPMVPYALELHARVGDVPPIEVDLAIHRFTVEWYKQPRAQERTPGG